MYSCRRYVLSNNTHIINYLLFQLLFHYLDMGLGKTFMSITLIWTLLNQGFHKGECAVKKVIVACPTSLVGNWDNEIKRWVGDKCNTFPVKSEPKRIIKNFLQVRKYSNLLYVN